MFDVLVAFPNGFVAKVFDCETGVDPPKIDAVLVLLLLTGEAVPPKIFCVLLAGAADAKILPVFAPELGADDTAVDDILNPPNALSIVFDAKILAPLACCGLGVSGDFAKLLVALVVGGVLAVVVIALPPKMPV